MTSAQVPALEPAILVIFGVTGDLAQRKVLPAIYHLFKNNLVHESTYIVGTSRSKLSVADMTDRIRQAITAKGAQADETVLTRLAEHMSTAQVDPVVDADYAKLRTQLQELEDSVGLCLHRLFYLSIPPQVYGGVVQRLGEQGLNQSCAHGRAHSRLLVEKPFGYDLVSAQELIAATAQHFEEAQIFRIDHYLAQETAQNILTFRAQNPLFNQIWNNRHITKITVTATEKIGIEGRANFYEQVGALRDLIQSHLLQLLSLTLMDIPRDMNAATIHEAKHHVLKHIEPLPANKVPERAVRGQYDTYRKEVHNPDSSTETYAAITLFSSDPEWTDIPLHLITGKALAEKHTSITVDFDGQNANRLQFRIQPDEGITLGLQVKKPGLSNGVEPTSLDFTYHNTFKNTAADAYERVVIEALRGDRTLFATDEEVLLAWHILQPLLDEWAKSDHDLRIYEKGSEGPSA
ncbi:MAG TPA: glucose-6-phosphate dehydrogenase [Candidatus Saccharimonadales bacterium]